MPVIDAKDLEDFACSLLHAGGVSPHEAEIVARSLVGSNLRGYDSHGVMRIPYYLDGVKSGDMLSGVELEVLDESETRVVGDAKWGLGQVQANRLLDKLQYRAHRSGIGIGTLYHCGHIGRLGEYCESAAIDGLVSLMMVNSHGSVVRVAPPGGRAPRLSTNPLGIGVPNGDEPLVLDFSTSATAEGKVRVKRIAGESIPLGWVLDNQGKPTTDPNDLYTDPPGSLLPMGGDQAYKGFGLSLMVEILTGALSGGAAAREEKFPKLGNCVFMLLIDPARFGGTDHFVSEVTQLIEYVRSCPRVEGVDEIILPGDPERKLLAIRSESGLSFDDENWSKLTDLAAQLEVATPPVRQARGT